jgi:hypothetical protein
MDPDKITISKAELELLITEALARMMEDIDPAERVIQIHIERINVFR